MSLQQMRDLLTEDHDWYIAKSLTYFRLGASDDWKTTQKWLASLDWRKKDCRTCDKAEDCEQCTESGKPVKVCDAWFPMSCERCGTMEAVIDTQMGLRCPDCFGLELLPECYGSFKDEDHCAMSCPEFLDCQDETAARKEEDLDWELSQ